MCPLIESSLKTSNPTAQDLDASAAHAFLTERAALLEQSGFGVLLPAWWTRKGTKLRLTVRAHAQESDQESGSGVPLGDVMQFDWQVALGDEV